MTSSWMSRSSSCRRPGPTDHRGSRRCWRSSSIWLKNRGPESWRPESSFQALWPDQVVGEDFAHQSHSREHRAHARDSGGAPSDSYERCGGRGVPFCRLSVRPRESGPGAPWTSAGLGRAAAAPWLTPLGMPYGRRLETLSARLSDRADRGPLSSEYEFSIHLLSGAANTPVGRLIELLDERRGAAGSSIAPWAAAGVGTCFPKGPISRRTSAKGYPTRPAR